MNSITIGVNDFVKRQVIASRFSFHLFLSFEAIAHLALDFWEDKKPGYAEGIFLVPVPVDGFVSGIVPLETATDIYTVFESRREGEEPVLVVTASGPRLSVTNVNLVVYSKEALGDDATCDSDFELVSINAGCDEPQELTSMARNSMDKEGGTKTDYPSEEWAESAWFWARHAMAH